MGLFDKKFCAVCGNKKDLFGPRIKDSQYLCSKCSSKLYYEGGIDIKLKNKISFDDMTMDDYKYYLSEAEKNLEELKQFIPTKTFENIQVDEQTETILIYNKYLMEDKEKMYLNNPPVIKIEDIALAMPSFSKIEQGTTITGKAKATQKVFLVLGVENPVYTVIKVPLGKMEAKEGFLGGTNVSKDPEIQGFFDVLNPMLRWEMLRMEEEGESLSVARNADAYWSKVAEAKRANYITADDVTYVLKSSFGRDRASIKEIRRTYGL